MQVAAQAALFLCMNTAGTFISYLSDRAQRQAFLETRRCIEARLRLETENQRQVRRPDPRNQARWPSLLELNRAPLSSRANISRHC